MNNNFIPKPLYNQILKNTVLCCVDCLIMDNNGRVLLVRRAEDPVKGDFWIPGGRVFHGELLTHAAHRKALEETGLDCVVFATPIHTEETFFPKGKNGIDIHSVNFVFLMYPKNQNIVCNQTISEYKWIDKIPTHFDNYNLHSYIIRILDKAGLPYTN